MLHGKSWTDIQEARRQRDHALAGLCIGVCFIALMIGLARGQASA